MNSRIEKHRLFRVMSLRVLAEVVLDPSTPGIERFNAAAMLRHRLRQFEGALWMGAPLEERNAVTTALRMT